MNAPDNFFLPDVQSAADTRRLAIQQVGVKGLRYPMQFETSRGEVMNTIAHLTMTVGLPPEVKGTHMSRFVELLEGRSGSLTQEGAFRMLEEMLLRLDARSGRIEMSFPYFIRKTAPVSGVESLLDYDATLIIEQTEGQASELDKIVEVFEEIHRSNMSKLDDNGQPIYREDGKIMKSNNYFLPDIATILER